jgi:prepilin-type N-terminal cleavage/methylation domain-containing protein
MRRIRAFTMIEMLTVIAIIALLAAIIFPVYARAKDGANRSSDITSMNALRTALQLYRADQGGYPPAILGYVQTYSGDPLGNDVIPAHQITGFLYPKRLPSLGTLKPAYVNFGPSIVTTAVWPNQDPRPVGSAPILDLNGDGVINAADDPAEARQRYGPSVTVTRTNPLPPFNQIPARFYALSGYDASSVRLPNNQTRMELRYALFWTEWGMTTGSPTDDPRQLGYDDPPEDTILTWNSFYREYDQGVPKRVKRDLVVFVGGAARTFDSYQMYERSWRQDRQ